MQQKTRAASFLYGVISWIYLILAIGMIGLAFYNLTYGRPPDVCGVTDAVFLDHRRRLAFAGIFTS
ncbi:MAG: hypothetical protein R2912_10275 [Eubacteriales bacterium]